MSRFCIVVDEKRCIQCHACEIHCQNWQGLSAEVHPGQLHAVPPHRNEAGQVVQRSSYVRCHHCEKPWCVRVCPTTAMRQREEDGIVYVVPGLCVGCKACLMACPWRVPQWSAALERMVKCDLCHERLDAGLQPACVTGCTGHALNFTDDPAIVQEQRALQDASRRARKAAKKSKGQESAQEG